MRIAFLFFVVLAWISFLGSQAFGAYGNGISEAPPIFQDGFESGDTVSWSETVGFPPPPTPSGTAYVPRPCGLDLDQDGIRGETEDCFICNGGGFSDEVYVDCENGLDSLDCGSPTSPCLSLSHALTRPVVGPRTVCGTGVCPADGLRINEGGAPLAYLVPASGNQEADWLYPASPVRIIGWDKNADGSYPPVDDTEPFVLDGENTANWAFVRPAAHLEIAHFEARRYNNERGNLQIGGGFLDPGGDASFLLVHDAWFNNINQKPTFSGTIFLRLFGSEGLEYVSFENNLLWDIGGYLNRGDAGNGAGPIRWQGNDIEFKSCFGGTPECASFQPTRDGAVTTVAKLWGHFGREPNPEANDPGLVGFEFVDNFVDCSLADGDWNSIDGCRGVNLAQCSQYGVVKGNTFIDTNIAVAIVGSSSGYCGDRPSSGHKIENNLIRSSWWDAPFGILTGNGSSPSHNARVGDVDIIDNHLEGNGWGNGGENCIFLNASPTGTIVEDGNVCEEP